MTVAVTCKLCGIVANSRVTDQTANSTHFTVGEAETLGTLNAEGKTKRIGAWITRARQGRGLVRNCLVPLRAKHHARVAGGGAPAGRIHADAAFYQSVRAEHLRTRRTSDLGLQR